MTFGGSALGKDYVAMRDHPGMALESSQPARTLPLLVSPSTQNAQLVTAGCGVSETELHRYFQKEPF